MIPYDELCEALARYRTRHGMANGPSASPQRVQAPVASATPAYTPPAYSPPAYSPPAGYAAQPARGASGEYPAQPAAFVPVATRDDYAGGPAPDDRTDIHTAAAPREDSTGEIDIDTADVVEEDDV